MTEGGFLVIDLALDMTVKNASWLSVLNRNKKAEADSTPPRLDSQRYIYIHHYDPLLLPTP